MAGKFDIQVGNKSTPRPGVYPQSNDRKMVPPRGQVGRSLVILAELRGGAVGAATKIGGEQDVLNILAGGPGAQLALAAVKRGADVYTIRVNKATPATLPSGDGTFTAVQFGLQGRAIQARRAVNAARADAVDVYLKDTRTGLSEPYLGLGPLADVSYAGTGTVPAGSVVTASGVTTVSFSATGAAGDAVSFTSDSLSSVQGLIDALNASGAWNARAVGDTAAPLTELTGGVVPFSGLIGTLGSGTNAQQRALSGSAIATFTPQVGSALSLSSYTFFTGGSEGGVPTVQDWQDALTISEKLPIYGVVLGTGDPAVIALAKAHAERMSDVLKRRERVVFAGPALQSTKGALKAALLNLATTLGSERLVLVGMQGQDYDVVTGKLTRVAAAAYAADAAAAYVAGSVAQGLTHVTCGIPVQEFEWDDGDLTDFLNGGVMPVSVDADDGTVMYEQGITTYTRDANVMRRKIAGVGIKDYLAAKVRVRLKRFIGQSGDTTTVTEIVSEIAAMLNEESRDGKNPSGVLVPGIDPLTGVATPAWRNIVATMDGFDVVGAEYEVHPVGEIGYILPTASFTPVRIVVTG